MIVPATSQSIARAAALLRKGELVAFPTETVYGLGADASNARAVAQIFAAKGRPAEHPLIVHVARPDALEDWAIDVPDAARALASAFWPGPLTLVLARSARVLDVVTGGQASIGLRMPSHPVALELLRCFGGGVAAPSANRFGCVSATTAQHVATEFGDEVALVLDGGPCAVGIESTIIDFTSGRAILLRPGGIDVAALERVLGYAPLPAHAHAPRAPGTLAAHYAPRTHSECVVSAALPVRLTQVSGALLRCGVLARTLLHPIEFVGVWVQAPADAQDYARTLYANLRLLDEAHVQRILIEAPPDTPEWFAINDRLRRATHRPE